MLIFSGDESTYVLTNKFQLNFFEEDPNRITPLYFDFLEQQEENKKQQQQQQNNANKQENLEETSEKETQEETSQGEKQEQAEGQNDDDKGAKEESNKAKENKHHNQEDSAAEVFTSIDERFGQGYYTSIYKLYHDVKLSSTILISNSKLGTSEYLLVDNFYKFATEFILQESNRLHLSLQEFQKIALKEESEASVSDFSESLSNDFNKISTSFKFANNESLFILTGQNNSLPLFSSLAKKSELDINEIQIPQPFNTMKVLPQPVSTPAASLAFVSPNPAKIPAPTLPPTEITRQIFHPNWFSLPSIPWLDTRFSNSFIPLIDETISVINTKNKGKIYFEQIGLQKLVKLREAHYEQLKKEAKKGLEKEDGHSTDKTEEGEDVSQASPPANGHFEAANGTMMAENTTTTVAAAVADPTATTATTTSTNADAAKNAIDTIDATDANGDTKLNDDGDKKEPEQKIGTLDINVKNLFEWKPENKFEDDEIEAFKNGQEQKYINKLLIDLNKLRAERYVTKQANQSRITKPSTKEKKLYYKVKRLLENIVYNLKPSDLVDNREELPEDDGSDKGLRFSQNIPALGMNYAGTLQAPLPVQYNNGRTTQRVAGQPHRTYKKRK